MKNERLKPRVLFDHVSNFLLISTVCCRRLSRTPSLTPSLDLSSYAISVPRDLVAYAIFVAPVSNHDLCRATAEEFVVLVSCLGCAQPTCPSVQPPFRNECLPTTRRPGARWIPGLSLANLRLKSVSSSRPAA